ncbi:MAG: hypothetical protein L0Z50_31970 [Verrucomicrobiales bacterium]|nr:hypothetical protein [Verrucomicrobiales bacterium]
MVRDEWGHPINISSAEVILEADQGTLIRSRVVPDLEPGVNYRLTVPMDTGITPDLYKPTAMREVLPYKVKVHIGQVIYLPIEMVIDFHMGEPSERTRLDLTLGEDEDHDGLPDAWERALIAAAGGGLSLADIGADDDLDQDGISNLNEYLAGTYAFDPVDGFALRISRINNGMPVLEFLAIRGRTYSIEASSDLRQWRAVSFRVLSPGAQTSLRGTYQATDLHFLQVQVPVQTAAEDYRYFRAIAR